jgi:hypothetical protein
MNSIKDTIIKQNQKISQYFTDKSSDELITKFFIKSKNENFKHLVIEITPALRQLIIETQKLNIYWSRHSVKDFISITRCFKCLGFGHTQSHCSLETDHCSQCAGTHSHKNCKSKNAQKKCVNCLKFNQNIKNPNVRPFDVNHDALYSSCPSLLRIKSIITSKISYD